MPSYPWLADHEVDPRATVKRMQALRTLGHPYSDEQIGTAEKDVTGKTELQALIAYLQGLGTNLQVRR